MSKLYVAMDHSHGEMHSPHKLTALIGGSLQETVLTSQALLNVLTYLLIYLPVTCKALEILDMV